MSTHTPSARPSDRLRGLPVRVQNLAREAQRRLEHGDLAQAESALDAALAEDPTQPELLRLCGLYQHFSGHSEAAVALLRKAARSWPDDGLIASNLGAALAQHGDMTAALRALNRATELDPTLLDAWFNLGRALELGNDAAGAHAAFSAVLELDPYHRSARTLRAEALKTLGRLAEAESELRRVLREDPASVSAWVALINLKWFRADAEDARALERLRASATLTPAQRIDIAFAYANLLESERRDVAAFAAFREANAAKRQTIEWNAAAVSRLVDDILAAFPPTSANSTPQRGGDVVFLVGMARSGSTLAEQILAVHPRVTAGGEGGWLARLLQNESARRGMRFPHWVADATADDWSRLGNDYLALAATRRRPDSLFTDKTLSNWQTLGAIRLMLPAARIVHCLRDPLETAWSCYKHNFADQFYSYDFDEIAAFYADSLRAVRVWGERYPRWIHRHRHEDLLADPERETRALLDACGLAFDPACLRFHEAMREVRTSSAAQVRVPLRADAAIAARYGAILDPLRAALTAKGVLPARN